MTTEIARRRFLKQVGFGGAALAGLPYFVPSKLLGATGEPSANETVNIAIIGSGIRARQFVTNMPATARIVAVCDVDLPKAKLAKKDLKGEWKIYQDYREILDKEPIDGLMLCTCDHNRVLPAIHACQASKDIYVEKPFSLYVTEGRALVKAVQLYKRICQTGTQARTIRMNQAALRMVREGKLGKLKSIACRNYDSNVLYPGGPEQPIPAGLDWDKWCGQTELLPYNEAIPSHWETFSNYSAFRVTALGAHAYDMIQCALGTDETGPVELWATNAADPNPPICMKYANGFEVSLEGNKKNTPNVGAIFTCENGKIELNETIFRSNPKELARQMPPPEPGEVGYRTGGWMGKSHFANWIECVKSRKRPNAYEEIGHRSATVCHLVNITKRLKRHLKWDPVAERFVGDDEANAMLDRPRRKGYELPTIPELAPAERV